MNTDLMFSTGNDNWATPRDLYSLLNSKYRFTFDPCPLDPDPKTNGLVIEWGDSNFVNPPYSRGKLVKWCKKAWDEWRKGKTVIMLIPCRTETVFWQKYIMNATKIMFIDIRLKFGNSKNSAPFPSAIVIFDKYDMKYHKDNVICERFKYK